MWKLTTLTTALQRKITRSQKQTKSNSAFAGKGWLFKENGPTETAKEGHIWLQRKREGKKEVEKKIQFYVFFQHPSPRKRNERKTHEGCLAF